MGNSSHSIVHYRRQSLFFRRNGCSETRLAGSTEFFFDFVKQTHNMFLKTKLSHFHSKARSFQGEVLCFEFFRQRALHS